MKHRTADEIERLWLVGRVADGEEFKVARHLRRDGVRVRVPAGLVLVRRRGERKRRPRPKALYGGYIFIDRSSVVDLEAICLRTPGFFCIITFGNGYAACEDETLMKAINYARRLQRMEQPRRAPSIRLGALVKVWGSSFGGYMGVIEAVNGGKARLNRYDFKIPTWIDLDRLIVQQVA